MQEDIVDVKLVNGPTWRESNGKHNTNGGLLDNRTEGVRKVKAFTLVESFGDKTGFVPFKRTCLLYTSDAADE